MIAIEATRRRTRTKAPGVYRNASGAYEIAYRDSDGRQVFEVVKGADFEQAKAERSERIAKLGRGEPVRRTRTTFGEFAETVMAGLTVRPRTEAKHRYHVDKHLLPRFRNRRLAEITTDDIARLVAEMQKGVYYETSNGRTVRKQRTVHHRTVETSPIGDARVASATPPQPIGFAGWTIAGTLSTLSLVMGKAKRKGLVPANPVADLERGERPKTGSGEKRVLEDAEIGKLLENGGTFRPLLAVLTFSGLRLGEALGLRWSDIGADGFIHVRRQLGRDREAAEIKTAAGRRDVVLMPQLAAVLTAHRLASLHSLDTDYVFAAPDGRGRDHRSVSRGIERAVKRAKLGDGVSAHNLRHTFASQLIVGLGLDPVRVSKQLGHTNAGFTASTYAHEFERARHADDLRKQMSDGFGRLLDVNEMSAEGGNTPQPEPAKIVQISRKRG